MVLRRLSDGACANAKSAVRPKETSKAKIKRNIIDPPENGRCRQRCHAGCTREGASKGIGPWGNGAPRRRRPDAAGGDTQSLRADAGSPAASGRLRLFAQLEDGHLVLPARGL